MENIFKSFKKEDFFKKVNLHIHSNFSDGKCTFEELLAKAQALGLEHFSITDHNTLLGYENLENPPKELIIGVEFDCYLDFNLPHVLGYGVDPKCPDIIKLTEKYEQNLFKRIFSSRNPKEVIDAIHKAGGIAVLAHPCCYWCINLDKFIKKFVDFGIDGIEAYYPYNRSIRVLKFHSAKLPLKLAQKYNLYATGGKDTHGNLED